MSASAIEGAAPPPRRFALPLTLRLALRDLRGGLTGFGVFLACIALGVAAIAGVGSVARGLGDGLAREGRVILGGDASFSLIHREWTAPERDFLLSRGAVTGIATMRAMARTPDARSSLVDVKAVDAQWPTAGAAVFDPPLAPAAVFARQGDAFGLAADAAFFARLDAKPGDRILIGDQPFVLTARLESEPDKLAGGVGLAPRVLMARDALDATGLVQPGSLTRFHYRVTLPGAAQGLAASDAAVDRLVADAKAAFPEAGWEVRGRSNVSPQFSSNLERFTQFLTLVGLTALVVGGVGVANAVAGFVDRKRASLATLKSLGATGGAVFALALTEVMLIAAIGVVLGLALGAAMPFLVAWGFGQLIPIPFAPALYPRELALGALYGGLTALAFALAPLGRVHDVPVSALFRDAVDPDARWPRRRYIVMTAAAAAALVATALFFAYEKRLALIYVGATVAAFLLLRGVALALMAIARRLPRPRATALRLALSNIHRPGALTPSVVLSLGLGLALLVALTLIESNIRAQLDRGANAQTPSFFFMDLRSADADAFFDFLKREAPDAKLERTPMMRGRIVRVKDQPAEAVRARENAAWALEGDRGVTYAAEIPPGSKLVAGQWWPAGYSGPPLVSMEQEIADGLGLALGDAITVNILGRNVSAKIANLRRVDWRTMGINFVLVYSPNTFAGAPHTVLATAAFPGGGDAAREASLLRRAAQEWPSVTSLRVRDALEAISAIVAQLALAVRAASGVAILSSILVLAGALAAGQRARIYDAVILKTLGATRARLLAAYLAEYGVIGLATGIFGLAAGTAAAWAIATKVMKLDFAFDAPAALLAAGGALALTVLLGLLGTWRVLGQKPSRHLRSAE